MNVDTKVTDKANINKKQPLNQYNEVQLCVAVEEIDADSYAKHTVLARATG